MTYLQEITVEELQTALDNVESKTAAQRLIAAIAYKDGVGESELAEWFSEEPPVITSWFKRLEAGPLHQHDQDPAVLGSPRSLTDAELEQLADAVDNSPSEVGYAHSNWNSGLITRYVREEFGVDYPPSRGKALASKARDYARD